MKPEVGLHKDVPEAVYHSWEAVNNSWLKHFDRSAAHAHWDRLYPSPQTPAMALGSAVHRGILEPHRFEEEYCRSIKCDRRTKVGKADWGAFVAKNADKEILKPEEFDACVGMMNSAWKDTAIADILKSPGHTEVSAAWVDEETGILCKGRMDRVSQWEGWTWLWDLKTTEDASEKEFRRAISKYDYHCQAAHYLDGLNALAPASRRFGIIAIEKKPPHCAAVYEMDPDDIEMGRYDNAQRMLKCQEALESDNWPGYPSGIKTIQLPGWRRKAYEYGD